MMGACTWVLGCSALLLLGSWQVDGYATGHFNTDYSACTFMLPSHGASASTTTAPYQITVSSTSYTPGSTIQVTISKTSPSTPAFRGFLMQPQQVASSTVRVGDFTAVAGTHLTCGGRGGHTISHNSNADKTSLTFTWTAPAATLGNFHFVMTIVQVKAVFWTNVKSQVITGAAGAPTTTTTPGPTVSQTQIAPIDLTTCGVSKSCMVDPPNCVSPNCNNAVTWKKASATEVDFEIQATLQSGDMWAGVGISSTQIMGDTNVMLCTHNQKTGSVDVQMSYNAPRSNSLLTDPYLGLVKSKTQGYYNNGNIICKFRRLNSVAATLTDAAKVLDLTQSWYMMLGQGYGDNTGGIAGHHKIPKTSPNKIQLTASTFVNVGGVTQAFPLAKAHGTLMLLAWMVMASSAILMPRYFKPAWPGKTLCGKQVWFAIHQPFMIIAVLFTIVGFILSFISANGYSQLDSANGQRAHPILGIIVTFLAILNPVMAAFRCAPGSKHRNIFNWAHFLVGLLAHILATATMFIGMYLPRAAMPSWSKWIMVAYIVWHILVEIILAVHARVYKGKERSKSVEMSAISGDEQPSSTLAVTDPGSGFKGAMFILHFVVVFGLAMTLIINLCKGP